MYSITLVSLYAIGLLSSGFFLVVWGVRARRAIAHDRLATTKLAVADFVVVPAMIVLISLLALYNFELDGIDTPRSGLIAIQRISVWVLTAMVSVLRIGWWASMRGAPTKLDNTEGGF